MSQIDLAKLYEELSGLAERSHERFTRVQKLRDELPDPFDSAAQRLYLASTVRNNGAFSRRLKSDVRGERKTYLVDMVVTKPIVPSVKNPQSARQRPHGGLLKRSSVCAVPQLDHESDPRGLELRGPTSDLARSHDAANGGFSFALRHDACRPVPHLAVGCVGGAAMGGPTIRPPFAPESAAVTSSIMDATQNCKLLSGERTGPDRVMNELESMWRKLEAAEDPDRLESYVFASTTDALPMDDASSSAPIDVTSRVSRTLTTKLGRRRSAQPLSSLSKRHSFAPLRVQGGRCHLKRDSSSARNAWLPNTTPHDRPSSAVGSRTTLETRLRPATALPSRHSSTTASIAVQEAQLTSVLGQVIRDTMAPRV